MFKFFSLPDKEKNYQEYMVYVMAILWSMVTGVIVSVGFIFFPHIWQRWLIFLAVSVFIALSTLTINRLGHIRFASWFLTIMVWLYITIPCYSAGGIMAPGILSQVSVIVTAGLLLGWKAGLAFGLLTIGADFGLVYLEISGNLPKPSVLHTPITRWISAIIPFSTILALQYYATNHLRSGLIALQREILKREESEKLKDQTVQALEKRVKELKTLYAVNHILQEEETGHEKLYSKIAKILPNGWQYPDFAAACVSISGKQYSSHNYKPANYSLHAEMNTAKGEKVGVKVVYLKQMPEVDEGPFLKEERSLINMLAEMLKNDVERRERSAELKDYKYALDLAAIVSIAGADANFNYVNENFCKFSKYTSQELLGKNYEILWSGHHSPEYFKELKVAMQNGKPYRGEFCNMAKDGTLYWVDSTIVPFLDDSGKIYQYLSISYDITERRETDERIKKKWQLIKKITSQVPGNTYMFEIEESGKTNILFMNRGTDAFNHNYDMDELLKHPEKFREVLHDDDKNKFNDAMKEAYRTQSLISFQYRILVNGEFRWRWMQAVPEKSKDDKVVWFGATSDITPLVDYIASVEQVIFDIGHVIRRPISTMMGLTKLIIGSELSEKDIKEISQKIYQTSDELDKFIHELNLAYQQKRENTQFDINISSLIDKRKSLFS